MVPSSFSSALDSRDGGGAYRHARSSGGLGGGGTGVAGAPWRVYDYRAHPSVCRSCSQWSSNNAEHGRPLTGHTTWEEGARVRDRGPLAGGADSRGVDSYGGLETDRGAPVASSGQWQPTSERNRAPPIPVDIHSNRSKTKERHPGGGRCPCDGRGGAGVDELPPPWRLDTSREHQHGAPSRAAPSPPSVRRKGGPHRHTGSLPLTSAPPPMGGGNGGTSSLPVEERGPAVGIDVPALSRTLRHPLLASAHPLLRHRPSHCGDGPARLATLAGFRARGTERRTTSKTEPNGRWLSGAWWTGREPVARWGEPQARRRGGHGLRQRRPATTACLADARPVSPSLASAPRLFPAERSPTAALLDAPPTSRDHLAA